MVNTSLSDIDFPRVSRRTVALIAIPLIAIATLASVFNQVFFYNEAGHMAHVRTIFGEEKVVEDVGYATQWFGRTTMWKRTIGVQSALQGDTHTSGNPTVTVGTLPIVFLGNVDAKAEFSTQLMQRLMNLCFENAHKCQGMIIANDNALDVAFYHG